MALPFENGDYVIAVVGEDVKHFNSEDTLLEGLYGAPTAQAVRGMVFDNDYNLYIRIDTLHIDKWLADGSGPTTIWDSTDHPNIPVVGKLATDGTTYLYFSDSVASDTLPHIYQLDLDGNLIETLVTLPDELPDTTYGVNQHLFGLSVDGTKLYGDYYRFDGSTVADTVVFEIPVATDVPAIVFDEYAPEGPPGEIKDIVPLLDGGFAVVWERNDSSPKLKRYDSSWSFIEYIAEETIDGLVVNGSTELMDGSVVPSIDENIMIALKPDGTRLIFGVGGDGMSEIWEYDLASKIIITKHITGAASGLRSFAFTYSIYPGLARLKTNTTQRWFRSSF